MASNPDTFYFYFVIGGQLAYLYPLYLPLINLIFKQILIAGASYATLFGHEIIEKRDRRQL
jgi:hypothetical protein